MSRIDLFGNVYANRRKAVRSFLWILSLLLTMLITGIRTENQLYSYIEAREIGINNAIQSLYNSTASRILTLAMNRRVSENDFVKYFGELQTKTEATLSQRPLIPPATHRCQFYDFHTTADLVFVDGVLKYFDPNSIHSSNGWAMSFSKFRFIENYVPGIDITIITFYLIVLAFICLRRHYLRIGIRILLALSTMAVILEYSSSNVYGGYSRFAGITDAFQISLYVFIMTLIVYLYINLFTGPQTSKKEITSQSDISETGKSTPHA